MKLLSHSENHILEATDDDRTFGLRIFGQIDSFLEFTAIPDLTTALSVLGEDDTLNLFLATPGGSVNVGLTVFNLMRMLAGKGVSVNTFGLGTVASMGSSILMAGDVRAMPRTGIIMVHNPQRIAVGGASEMESARSNIEAATEALVATFTTRGVSEDVIRPLLDAETFLTAEQALEAGIITDIVEPELIADFFPESLVAQIDPENFINNGVETMSKDNTDSKAAAIAERQRVVTIMAAGKGNDKLVAYLIDNDYTVDKAQEVLALAGIKRDATDPAPTEPKAKDEPKEPEAKTLTAAEIFAQAMEADSATANVPADDVVVTDDTDAGEENLAAQMLANYRTATGQAKETN